MYPNVIQNPVVQERLMRWLGIRQPSSTPTLSPELVAVVVVDDLSRTAKGGRVPTVRQWCARAAVTAVNFSTVRIANRVNTDPSAGLVVQRIRRITVCCPNTPSFPIYFQLVTGIAAGTAVADTQKAWVDCRLEGTPEVSVRTLDAGVGPVLTDQFYEDRNQGGAVRVIEWANPIVLFPGQVGNTKPNVLVMMAGTTGTTMAVSIEGEEEPLIG